MGAYFSVVHWRETNEKARWQSLDFQLVNIISPTLVFEADSRAMVVVAILRRHDQHHPVEERGCRGAGERKRDGKGSRQGLSGPDSTHKTPGSPRRIGTEPVVCSKKLSDRGRKRDKCACQLACVSCCRGGTHGTCTTAGCCEKFGLGSCKP